MSSFQSEQVEVDRDEAKKVREKDIRKELKEKIRYRVYKEMLLPEDSLQSAIDVGLGINRMDIVQTVLKELVEEIEKISENSR